MKNKFPENKLKSFGMAFYLSCCFWFCEKKSLWLLVAITIKEKNIKYNIFNNVLLVFVILFLFLFLVFVLVA